MYKYCTLGNLLGFTQSNNHAKGIQLKVVVKSSEKTIYVVSFKVSDPSKACVLSVMPHQRTNQNMKNHSGNRISF